MADETLQKPRGLGWFLLAGAIALLMAAIVLLASDRGGGPTLLVGGVILLTLGIIVTGRGTATKKP